MVVRGELQLIRTFVETAATGSIASAARALNITRSAASKNIRALEDSLGVRLLNRNTRRLSLTEPGRVYLEKAKGAVAQLDEARTDLRKFSGEVAGVLVINAAVLFGRLFLSGPIRRFLATYPEATVDLRLSDHLIDAVSENVDLYFRTGRIQDQEVIARKWLDITFRTVAAPSYLAEHSSPETIDALAVHNCLGFRYPTDHRMFQWRYRSGGDIRRVSPKGNLISTDAEELRVFALNGLGVAHLPNQLVDDDIREGRLVELFADMAFVSNELCLCYPESRREDRKVQAFIECLTADHER